ncbi:AMP-binding protein [Helicobacter bizzozeronii]|uniref:AMP-binding protein n=1 Tax=Helicobacter bizzozeronii TaxID=56877 RepID=UPI001F25D9B3
MVEVGVVPIMLDNNMDFGLINQVLVDYNPEFIWLPSVSKSKFIEMGYKEVWGGFSYVLLRTADPTNVSMHNDLAILLSTSGSTGSCKMVRQSYRNIQVNTESIIQYLHIDSSQRAILILPMHYTFGLSVINTHLYSGAVILLSNKSLMQKQLWEFIQAKKATSISGVPYTYEMLKKLRFFSMDLPYLKTMTQAGGKLSQQLHQEFATFAKSNDKEFIVMYGQTEATARMGYLPADRSLEKCGSIGIAIPNGEFSLLDSQGAVVDQNDEQGELVYRGENVALGYAYDRSSLSKGDEFGGVLYTGDIAKKDNDGYYYIVGRKSRFIKMFGRRISLDDVDCIVENKFKDMEAKSSGTDDLIYIFITQEKCKEVKELVCNVLRLPHTAIKVKYIHTLPRNGAGKILYSKLEEHYD